MGAVTSLWPSEYVAGPVWENCPGDERDAEMVTQPGEVLGHVDNRTSWGLCLEE